MKLLVLLSVLFIDQGASFSISVKEGDPVTLYAKKAQEDRIKWYYNDTLIAQISRDSKTCTDVQCKDGDKRFRGRLKLDHPTGSLTIMYTTNTDAGQYHLLITSDRSDNETIYIVSVQGVSEVKRKTVKEGESVTLDSDVKSISSVQGFDVTVTADPGSGLSAGAVAGISVAVLLLVFVAAAVTVGVIYSRYRSSSNGMIFKTVMELKQLKAPVESPISKMEKDGGNDRGNVI